LPRTTGLHEIIDKVRNELATSMIMRLLTNMMIVSEAWRENNTVHIVAWIPDIDPRERTLAYKKKHILYDESAGQVIAVRDEAAKEPTNA